MVKKWEIILISECKKYTFENNKCYIKITINHYGNEEIFEEEVEITKEEFLEKYEDKECAKFDFNLGDSKITEKHWYIGLHHTEYEYIIEYEPSKEIEFRVLNHIFKFKNCTITIDNETLNYWNIVGTMDDVNIEAIIHIDFKD